MTRRDLALEIADHGRREEFHQQLGNVVMFEYHKARRKALERIYRQQ